MDIKTVIRAASKYAGMVKTADTDNLYTVAYGVGPNGFLNGQQQTTQQSPRVYKAVPNNETWGGKMGDPVQHTGAGLTQVDINAKNRAYGQAAYDAYQNTGKGIFADVGHSVVTPDGRVINRQYAGLANKEQNQWRPYNQYGGRTVRVVSRAVEAQRAKARADMLPSRPAPVTRHMVGETWDHTQYPNGAPSVTATNAYGYNKWRDAYAAKMKPYYEALEAKRQALENGSTVAVGINTRKDMGSLRMHPEVDERFIFMPKPYGSFTARPGKQYRQFGKDENDNDVSWLEEFKPEYSLNGNRALNAADLEEDLQQRAADWLSFYRIGGDESRNVFNQKAAEEAYRKAREQMADKYYHSNNVWTPQAMQHWRENPDMKMLFDQSSVSGSGLSDRLNYDQFIRSFLANVSQMYPNAKPRVSTIPPAPPKPDGI